MNDSEDQRLQHQLDHWGNTADATDPNAQAYQRLYEALATAPPSSLPEGFADQVVASAMPPRWYHRYGYVLSLTAWTMLSLLLCGVAVYYTDAAFLRNFTAWLIRFKEVTAFGAIALLLIQLGDHWLVKSR